MPTWLLVLIVILLAGVLLLLGALLLQLSRLDGRSRESRAATRQQLGTLETSMHSRLDALREATGRVVTLGASVDQLARSLASPKARGAFGELSLERLLADLLPAAYVRRQWPVEDGLIADAAILLPEGALVLDAKFPLPAEDIDDSPAALRAFCRAVRQRATEIATRYIRPPRTLGFAFMFVPAESIYHRVIMQSALHAQLLEMRVVPVSPNTLYAFLQTVALGLRGLRIEERAQEIAGAVAALEGQWERYADHFRKVGVHLDNARAQFAASERESSRMSDRLASLRLGVSPEPHPASPSVHAPPVPSPPVPRFS